MKTQLDLFLDADPADLVLPTGVLISSRALARSLGRHKSILQRAVGEARLDAFRFTASRDGSGVKHFIPRPAAARYLRAEGVI